MPRSEMGERQPQTLVEIGIQLLQGQVYGATHSLHILISPSQIKQPDIGTEPCGSECLSGYEVGKLQSENNT